MSENLEYQGLVAKAFELSEQITLLQQEKSKIYDRIIELMKVDQKLKVTCDDARISLHYKYHYEFDVRAIYAILEPKNMFNRVCAIKKSSLDTILKKDKQLRDDEVESLLNAVRVTKISESLEVKRAKTCE